MVRRDAAGVRLLTRNGHDWADRYPLIAAAAGALGVRSCLIDREAVACDGDGMPVFDRLRYRRQDRAVFLFGFDLLELNGQDLGREPIEIRKRELGKLLRWSAQIGLQLNEHIAESGDVVFRHASLTGKTTSRCLNRICFLAEEIAMPTTAPDPCVRARSSAVPAELACRIQLLLSCALRRPLARRRPSGPGLLAAFRSCAAVASATARTMSSRAMSGG